MGIILGGNYDIGIQNRDIRPGNLQKMYKEEVEVESCGTTDLC